MLGRGEKLFFPGKKVFPLSQTLTPFQKKRGMFAPVGRKTGNINLSYPYSRSERFTFAAGKRFTLRSNASRRIYPALHVGLHTQTNTNAAPLSRQDYKLIISLLTKFTLVYSVNQASRNQERYRTAGRVLQVRADRSVLTYVTGGSNAARRAPAKRDRSVYKTNFYPVRSDH